MVNPILTAQIFSTLGNNSSLIPLGVKDVCNSLGLSTGSYVTGSKVEGKDRFIDEFGTLAIWLLGIPFFKKVIDKTVYKLARYNPNIDTRILKDPDIFQKAKEHALPEFKQSFERVEKNQKLFKGLFLGKFTVATALTFASYYWLTKARHKHTEQAVIKEIKKEEQLNQAFMAKQTPKSFKQAIKPSFGLNLAQFMFDPVKNTMIIDAGITGQRLSTARSPQDFLGYVIKEGSVWAFVYFLGGIVQEHLEKKAADSGKPIDLDIRVLQDKKFQAAFKDGSIRKHLADFSTEGTDAQVYESLFNQGDNLIVQMAKKSGIIQTENKDDLFTRILKNIGIKENKNEMDLIDSQYYINMEAIKGTDKQHGIKGKIRNLYNKFKQSGKKTDVDVFFKELTKLKRMSIAKNIGYSILFLGVITPAIMVASRFANENNKEFSVKKELKEKLKKNKEISQ